MGMIYKRKWKDGAGKRHEGKTFWIKYYRDGKPYFESSKSHKETEAKKLLKRREGEISLGKLPGIYFDRVRFDDLAEELLLDYRINRRKSLERLKISIKHLTSFFQGFRVTQITTAKIQTYIEQRLEWTCERCKASGSSLTKKEADRTGCPSCGAGRDEGLKLGAANATINRELSALKRMLNLGARQTPPKVDRVPYIPMLKENNTRKGFFEHKEYLELLKALPSDIRPVVTFGYNTGWRKGEILGLTWDKVDLQENTVRLEADETKNSEARTIYLDGGLIKLLNLQNLKRHKGCRYVFHRNGTMIKDFRRAWKTACEEVDIEGKLFHDLRRTAIRNMVRSGIQERVAMRISGHKTRAVFDRYNIISPDDLKQAALKIGQYHDGYKTVTITDSGQKPEAADQAQVVNINK